MAIQLSNDPLVMRELCGSWREYHASSSGSFCGSLSLYHAYACGFFHAFSAGMCAGARRRSSSGSHSTIGYNPSSAADMRGRVGGRHVRRDTSSIA